MTRKGCAGFSLLEVIVAFAVAALVLAAAAQLLSSAARHAIRMQEQSRAIALAESKLAQAGIADAIAPGETAAGMEGALRWQRRVEPFLPEEDAAAADAGWTAYRVSVEVRWGAGRAVTLDTVRLAATR